jgi:hypothetical protein
MFNGTHVYPTWGEFNTNYIIFRNVDFLKKKFLPKESKEFDGIFENIL